MQAARGRSGSWASPHCASSFRTWSAARADRTRHRCATPRCAPRSPRHSERCPRLPLFAGGRSFGGRMTSQAQAHARCRGCADSSSWDFRCTRPGHPGHRSAPSTCERVQRADAVRAGHARCASRAVAAASRYCGELGTRASVDWVARRGPLLPRAGTHRPQGPRRCAGRCSSGSPAGCGRTHEQECAGALRGEAHLHAHAGAAGRAAGRATVRCCSWCRSTPRAPCTTTSGSSSTGCSSPGRCPRARRSDPGRQAHGGAGRGSSVRLRLLRGRDPGQAVRRRQRHRLGLRRLFPG